VPNVFFGAAVEVNVLDGEVLAAVVAVFEVPNLPSVLDVFFASVFFAVVVLFDPVAVLDCPVLVPSSRVSCSSSTTCSAASKVDGNSEEVDDDDIKEVDDSTLMLVLVSSRSNLDGSRLAGMDSDDGTPNAAAALLLESIGRNSRNDGNCRFGGQIPVSLNNISSDAAQSGQ